MTPTKTWRVRILGSKRRPRYFKYKREAEDYAMFEARDEPSLVIEGLRCGGFWYAWSRRICGYGAA